MAVWEFLVLLLSFLCSCTVQAVHDSEQKNEIEKRNTRCTMGLVLADEIR